MSGRRWIATVCLSLSLLSIAGLAVAGGEHVKLRIVEEQKALQLQIYVISPRITFPMGLSREDFDQYVAKSGANYVLKINERSVTRRIVSVVESVDFEVEPDDSSIDLRFRVDFQVDGKVLRSIYADKFGRIFERGRVMRPLKGTGWLRSISSEIQRDALALGRDIPAR